MGMAGWTGALNKLPGGCFPRRQPVAVREAAETRDGQDLRRRRFPIHASGDAAGQAHLAPGAGSCWRESFQAPMTRPGMCRACGDVVGSKHDAELDCLDAHLRRVLQRPGARSASPFRARTARPPSPDICSLPRRAGAAPPCDRDDARPRGRLFGARQRQLRRRHLVETPQGLGRVVGRPRLCGTDGRRLRSARLSGGLRAPQLRQPRAGPAQRGDDPPARDAYGALAWLRTRPDVDGARIGLQGWSNGGSATLAAMAAADGLQSRLATGLPGRTRVLSGLRPEGVRGYRISTLRTAPRADGRRGRGSVAQALRKAGERKPRGRWQHRNQDVSGRGARLRRSGQEAPAGRGERRGDRRRGGARGGVFQARLGVHQVR